MIITRTPLRLEFLGGSTDMKSFYQKQTGHIVAMGLEQSVYVAINDHFEGKLKVSYDTVIEHLEDRSKLQHSRVREALRRFNIQNGIEITSISDVSSRGTGLGSSGSFTVGLVHALAARVGKKMSTRELAELACAIEIDDLQEPIGKQDQYATAFGGLRHLIFHKDGYVDIKPIKLSAQFEKKFTDHLLTFSTGAGHSASHILSEQNKKEKENFLRLVEMGSLAQQAAAALHDEDLRSFARLMATEWKIKQTLHSGITSPLIERMISRGCEAGAWDGRLSGAGAGGFVAFFAPPAKHAAIIKALKAYRYFPLTMGKTGSEVIFRS